MYMLLFIVLEKHDPTLIQDAPNIKICKFYNSLERLCIDISCCYVRSVPAGFEVQLSESHPKLYQRLKKDTAGEYLYLVLCLCVCVCVCVCVCECVCVCACVSVCEWCMCCR